MNDALVEIYEIARESISASKNEQATNVFTEPSGFLKGFNYQFSTGAGRLDCNTLACECITKTNDIFSMSVAGIV